MGIAHGSGPGVEGSNPLSPTIVFRHLKCIFRLASTTAVVGFVDIKSSTVHKAAKPHKFRATFLTRLLQSGCDIANVQALAGHKNIKTAQRYLGTSTQL